MTNIITIQQVEKYFHHKKVLSIPKLTIQKGEVISILGSNGAGKSTLLKIISGLLLQDTGTVEVAGLSNRSRKSHEKVKFVLESGKGYYDYLSAKQNMEYFLRLN